ncbi:MAG TPA: hypothetical protein VFB58_05520 [Chloroflexota bacterium]|nr:hypothetical protein [Chloroflexota bacterium]
MAFPIVRVRIEEQPGLSDGLLCRGPAWRAARCSRFGALWAREIRWHPQDLARNPVRAAMVTWLRW